MAQRKVLESVKHNLCATSKDLKTHRYSTKNHSFEFRCPMCGRSQRQNVNFLGYNLLACDGVRFHRIVRLSPEFKEIVARTEQHFGPVQF